MRLYTAGQGPADMHARCSASVAVFLSLVRLNQK